MLSLPKYLPSLILLHFLCLKSSLHQPTNDVLKILSLPRAGVATSRAARARLPLSGLSRDAADLNSSLHTSVEFQWRDQLAGRPRSAQFAGAAAAAVVTLR